MTAGRRTAGAERAAIEAEYPGWEVTLSALGRWYAAPRRPAPLLPGGRECRPSLGAGGPDEMRNVLDAWGARRAGGTA